MSRSLQTLVLALLATLTTASGAAAFAPKTALRAHHDFSPRRVGLLAQQLREVHWQNSLEYGELASDASLASRAGPQVLRSVGAAANRVVNFGGRQLQSKFGHAVDFGISGPWNKGAAEAFEAALQSHVDDAATMIIKGTYRGQEVVHFVNPSTGLNVMKGIDDAFISGWRLSAEQLQNVLARGSL
jgi:hypothetical protein